MKRSPGRQGFSLLEMVVAMFIISILMGMAIVATRSFLSDEDLRSASRKLELAAKMARQQALLENRAYEIVFEPGQWTLRPAETEEASAQGAAPAGEDVPEFLPYILPETVKMKIRRWGDSDWNKDRELIWYFSSTGLCAPTTFRFEKGESWRQITMNPLTANVQDEEYYFP